MIFFFHLCQKKPMMLHTSLITDSMRKTWMVAMCGHTLSSDYFTSHLGGVVGESQIEFRGLPEKSKHCNSGENKGPCAGLQSFPWRLSFFPSRCLKTHLWTLTASATHTAHPSTANNIFLQGLPCGGCVELVWQKTQSNLTLLYSNKPSHTAQPCSEASIYLQTHSCTYIHVNKIQGILKIRSILIHF